MKEIYFNTESGQLMLNNIPVAPLDGQKFIATMKENAIDIEKHTTGTHIRNFSTSGSLKGLEFGINFIFDCAHMQTVWMSWDGGNTKKYGYDTTESQLLSDKDTLVKLLSKSFNRNPDEINKASSTFQFPWGHISASASIQSSTAAIGISWNFLEIMILKIEDGYFFATESISLFRGMKREKLSSIDQDWKVWIRHGNEEIAYKTSFEIKKNKMIIICFFEENDGPIKFWDFGPAKGMNGFQSKPEGKYTRKVRRWFLDEFGIMLPQSGTWGEIDAFHDPHNHTTSVFCIYK